MFSAVGLLPAALQGLDINESSGGRKNRWMKLTSRSPEISKNPAALLALTVVSCRSEARGEKAMVILPYKDKLQLFSRYLQQLVMESLGKEKDLARQKL